MVHTTLCSLVLKVYIYIRSLEQRYIHISLLRLIVWVLLEFVYIIQLVMCKHTLGASVSQGPRHLDVQYSMFR